MRGRTARRCRRGGRAVRRGLREASELVARPGLEGAARRPRSRCRRAEPRVRGWLRKRRSVDLRRTGLGVLRRAAADTAQTRPTTTPILVPQRPDTDQRTSRSSARTRRGRARSGETRCAGAGMIRSHDQRSRQTTRSARWSRVAVATRLTSRPDSASRSGCLTGRAHVLPTLVVPALSSGGVVIECRDAAVPSRILPQGEVHRLLLAPRAGQARTRPTPPRLLLPGRLRGAWIVRPGWRAAGPGVAFSMA